MSVYKNLTIINGRSPKQNASPRSSPKRNRKKKLLLQPRAGVALIDEHIRLLKYLETEGAADLLPTTIDAYTRQKPL